MCANDRVLCHEDFCRFARSYPEKMSASNVLGRLRDSHPHLDPDVVFEEARREEVCPFEVQLELAERADAIVADYNYVFEPAAALRHLAGEDLRDAILVVDEAHNLPDRARGIFSPEILEEDLTLLAGRLRLQPGALFEDLLAAVEALGEILREAAEDLPEGEAIAEIEPPRDAILDLRAAWEPTLMTSGVYRPSQAVKVNNFAGGAADAVRRATASDRVLYYHEGINASVILCTNAESHELWLRVGGKVDASTLDMETQVLLGLLPAVLADSGARALVIGHGSGVTTASVLAGGAGATDVVELEPGVIAASRWFHAKGQGAGRTMVTPRAHRAVRTRGATLRPDVRHE